MDENWAATDSIDIYVKFIQILKIAGNHQFEFFLGDMVMNDIGCSAESTNQKSPKFKKSLPCQDDLTDFSKISSNF